MERPEAQDAGTIILTGFDPDVVLDSIGITIAQFKQNLKPHATRLTPEVSNLTPHVTDYSITDTSWRVLKLIMGNTKLSNLWNGINV